MAGIGTWEGDRKLLVFNKNYLRKIHLRMDRLPTPGFLGFPGGSGGKESTCNAGKLGFNPSFGKIPWGRAWWSTSVFLPGESPWQGILFTVHGVAKS